MTSTAQENTDWISKWISNHPYLYGEAQEAASDGPDALRDMLMDVLTKSREGSDYYGTYETAREMTPSDYDTVDWDEIVAVLIGDDQDDDETDDEDED